MVYRTPTKDTHKTIHKGTKVISQGQVISLKNYKHIPWNNTLHILHNDLEKYIIPIQFQRQKDELQDVHGTK